MSLFGALTTAVSGLDAQSAAFSTISDNVANTQTTGFKSTNTSFADYLTESNQQTNDPGSVVAYPQYQNALQGQITQTTNPLNAAISGQGFFSVSQTSGTSSAGAPEFNPQTYYTRAGDFSLDKNGYLVNSEGYALNGWAVDPATGVANTSVVAPIQVSQADFPAQPTTQVNLAANLPATPAAGTPITTQLQVYDSLGTAHTVTLNWTQTSANSWTVAVVSPDDVNGSARGTADVTFGGALASGTAAAGTPSDITADATNPGTVTGSANTAGAPATFSFTTNFGSGNQTISINLGTYDSTAGSTQYAGTTYSTSSLTQNGLQAGTFSSAALQSNGDVVASYSNGQTQVLAQVPLTTFAAPDQLQRQDAQTFTATEQSGVPLTQSVGANGAGSLVTESVEGSNVDLGSELSKLIVAQEAYSANAKVVTTADTMLQVAVSMNS